jgi:hypothetical protein
MELIQTQWGHNNTRKAEVYATKECFVVRLYQDEEVVEDREMITNGTVHNMRYAEDCAENWCLGYHA